MQNQLQLPHAHQEEGAPGSRARPLSLCPLSWLGRARGRDQDTAGLSRAGDRLCPDGRTMTEPSFPWSRPGAGGSVPSRGTREARTGTVPLSWVSPCPVPARARCQHSLTRVSVRPEPLPGALPPSLSILGAISCCSQPPAHLGLSPSQPRAIAAESPSLRGWSLSRGMSHVPSLDAAPSLGMSPAPFPGPCSIPRDEPCSIPGPCCIPGPCSIPRAEPCSIPSPRSPSSSRSIPQPRGCQGNPKLPPTPLEAAPWPHMTPKPRVLVLTTPSVPTPPSHTSSGVRRGLLLPRQRRMHEGRRKRRPGWMPCFMPE